MITLVDGRIQVIGPMVVNSVAMLKNEGARAIITGSPIIDLSGVTEADSAAVATLLAWTRLAEDHNLTLSIVGCPQSIRSLAVLYGVADLLPLV
jgi:phospholipid transport system transporter-binding protein